jgi:hypothetical protein
MVLQDQNPHPTPTIQVLDAAHLDLSGISTVECPHSSPAIQVPPPADLDLPHISAGEFELDLRAQVGSIWKDIYPGEQSLIRCLHSGGRHIWWVRRPMATSPATHHLACS